MKLERNERYVKKEMFKKRHIEFPLDEVEKQIKLKKIKNKDVNNKRIS